MNNKSLESSSSTMLMPHETDGSIVGHHNFNDQMHHGTSFYHTVNVFNTSFHSSFQDSYPVNTSSFSNLSNMSTSIPPLIHQEAFYTSNHSNVKNEEEPASISHQTSTEVEHKDDEKVPDTNVDDEDNNLQTESQVVEEIEEPEPEVDIVISNVVCAFSVRCQLSLKEIALNGCNVEFKRENGMVTMKLRNPLTTASIWSSGKITCTGATSEEMVRHSQHSLSSQC